MLPSTDFYFNVNLVVITTDAGHGRRGGGGRGGRRIRGRQTRGEGDRENCFMAFSCCKNLIYMSSNCITYLNH